MSLLLLFLFFKWKSLGKLFPNQLFEVLLGASKRPIITCKNWTILCCKWLLWRFFLHFLVEFSLLFFAHALYWSVLKLSILLWRILNFCWHAYNLLLLTTLSWSFFNIDIDALILLKCVQIWRKFVAITAHFLNVIWLYWHLVLSHQISSLSTCLSIRNLRRLIFQQRISSQPCIFRLIMAPTLFIIIISSSSARLRT